MAKYGSSDIITKSTTEHIRDLSSFYIRDKNTHEGLTHIFKELMDNSLDEARSCGKEDVRIDIVFFKGKDRYQVLIKDTGRGIPIDKLKAIYSEANTSGKWSDAYSCSTGVFGIGSKVTSSLSTRFSAISNRQEGIAQVLFKEGNTLKDKIRKKKQSPSTNNVFGTTVFYEPDKKMFKTINSYMDGEGFAQVIKLLEFSYSFVFEGNITLRVIDNLVDHSVLERSATEVLKYFNNVLLDNPKLTKIKKLNKLDYCAEEFGLSKSSSWTSGPITKQINSKDKKDTLGYDLEFYVPSKNLKYINTSMLGAVNMSPINDTTSSHILGFVEAIRTKLSDYEDNEDVQAYIKLNYKIPIIGYSMVLYKNAVFSGAAKEEFKDKIFLKLFTSQLSTIFKKQFTDTQWENLYDILKEDIHLKYKKYNKRVLSLGKDLKNINSRLKNPACYNECKSNNSAITELFIAEGTSAGGAVGQVCDKEYQAVFKSRGKPFNASKKSKGSEDAIYLDLVKIIGVSPYDNNLDNMNFSKVFILCDADLVA